MTRLHRDDARHSFARSPRRASPIFVAAVVLAAGLASLSASKLAAQSFVASNEFNTTGYTVPTTAANLLSTTNGATLSATPSNAQGDEGTTTSWSVLTDGSFGIAGSIDKPNDAVAHQNNALTYTLNTGANPLGFAINNIDTYTGWQDGGRVNQSYTVFYSTVGSPSTFTSLGTVNFGSSGNNSEHVNLATSNLFGVAAIRFVFNGQQNGYVGYRELAVAGTAITGSTWNGGSLTSSNWTDGANWGGAAPTAGNALFFGGSMNVATVNDFAPNTGFSGLTFNSGAAAFTISGNAVNLLGDVVNNSANLQTVNVPLTIPNINLNAASGDILIGGVISGASTASGVTLNGSHTVTLNAANTYGGVTTINAGTLRLGDGTTNTGSVAGDIVNNSALVFANPGSLTYGGSIRGTGSLTKTGTGTLSLTNAYSSYTGPTTVNNGTLRLAGPTAKYTFNGTPGALSNGATITDVVNGRNGTVVGNGASIIAGGQFGQALSLDGATYVSVPESSALDLHTYTISTWFNLNNVNFQGLFDTRNGGGNTFDLKVSTGTGGVASVIHGDVGAGGGNWINTGVDITGLSITPGSWHMVTYVVTPTGGQTYFDGVARNSYAWSGTPLLMQGGSLLIGNSDATALNGSLDDVFLTSSALNASQVAALYANNPFGNLPATTPVTIGNGGVVDLNAYNQSVASLSGVAGAIVTNGGSTASVITVAPAAATTTTFAGVIQDGAGGTGLTVNGSGVQVLSGANTYTGPTTVLGGELRLAATGSLAAASTVTIGGSGASGTPTLSGTGSAAGTVRINGPSGGVAGHVAPGLNTSGNFGAIGPLGAGNLTLNGGSILDFDFGAPGQSDDVVVGGVLTLPTSGNVTLNLNNVGGMALGTYKLFTFSSIANFNPTAIVVGTSSLSGKSYSFTNTGSELDVTIGAKEWSASAATSAWQTSTNWVGGAIPGATGTTTNTDTATFDLVSTTQTVLPDAGRNLQNIVFDSAAGPYLIGATNGAALHLSNGGSIQSTSSVGNTETVNAPLVIEGAGASYRITNDAASSSNTLRIGGMITGNGAGVTTLSLTGSNSGNNTVSGVISDGGGGNTLAVVKNGSGTWVIVNSHPYTGGTTVSGGVLQLGDGASTNGSIGNVLNNATLTFANPLPQTYSGAINGSGAVKVTGAATLTFTNASSNSGITTINPGSTLQLGDGTTNNGSVGGNITNNGSLIFGNPNPLTYNGSIGGGGNVTKNAAGTLTLGGIHTYAGSTAINNGTLRLGSAASGPQITVPNGDFTTGATAGSYVYNPSGASWTFLNNSGVATNGSAFNVTNAPSGFAAFLQNSGNNGAFGQNINFPASGTYAISFLSEFRPGYTGNPFEVRFNGSPIAGLTNLLPIDNVNFNSMTGLFNVPTAGTYSIAFVGTGTGATDQTSFVDNVTISQGASLPTTTSLSIAGGATFDLNGNVQQVAALSGPASATITNSNSSAAAISVAPSAASTYDGLVLDGAGPTGVTVNGPGTLVLTNAGNTYSGNTTINGGALRVGSATAVQNSTVVVNVNGGLTFAAGNTSPTLGGLAGTGNVVLQDLAGTPAAVTPIVGGNNASTIYSGVLSGPGGLTKAGSGTLTIGNVNNYTGPTTINGGTLRLGPQFSGTPLVHYPLDGTPGPIADGDTIVDSASGINGTMTGTGASYVAGHSGQAISFTGSQSVVVPNTPALQLSGNFTVSAWFNMSSLASNTNGIVGTRFGGQDQTFDLKVDGPGQKIHGDVGDGANWINTSLDMSNLLIGTNQWHMVTYVLTPNGGQLYFDGVDKADYTWSGNPTLMTASGTQLQIGNAADPGEFMNGSIDDVSIFSSALSSNDVAALYNNTVAAGLPATTSLDISSVGTFDLNGGNQAVTALSGAVGAIVTNNGFKTSTLTITPAAASSATFDGVIQDGSSPVSLTINGPGTQILTGPNSYTGSTTVTNGTLTTTGSGSLGTGPLTVSAADTITSTVNLGNGQTVSSLSGTIGGSGVARLNVADGTTLTVDQANDTTFAGNLVLTGSILANGGGTLTKLNSGALEIGGAPSFGNNSKINVAGGTLRFKVNNGTPVVGSAVSATVSNDAVLELAGSLSSLGGPAPAARVDIANNSTAAAGVLVSGGHQQVGGIDGTGNVEVQTATTLTANHITAGALIIDGDPLNSATVTIAASDSSGNPSAESSDLALVSTLGAGAPLSQSGLSLPVNSALNLGGGSFSLPRATGGLAAVPEPSTIVIALAGLAALAFARRNRQSC